MATAIALELPEDFKVSYQKFSSYPANLVQQTSYVAALKACIARLNLNAPTLFVENDSDIEVPFRDFRGQAFERQNIHSDKALQQWLGDQSIFDIPSQSWVGDLATKVDPKCRFVFLWAGDSRRRLKITRDMLLRILSYHQVMTGYLDFIFVFGSQTEPREIRFSGFREHTSLSNPARNPILPSLGRSGRLYQLCYNLKAVACLTPADTNAKKAQWSIRQAACHHQFDIEEGTTLWIIAKGDRELKDRIQEMTGVHGRAQDRAFDAPLECFRSSLAVHLLQCHWSVEEWRWYIQWLENVTELETGIAVHLPRTAGQARYEFTSTNLQTVQYYEDKTNEAIMVMEANADVLGSIRRFYERLLANPDFTLGQYCREDVLTFASQIDDMIYDAKMQIARAQVLVRITADRKNLVLQHLQTQAAEKMEGLTISQSKASDRMERLTISMHKIAALAQRDAVVMRIITVVTLFYLPATFVSTFFSTDIVKYQGQNGGSSFSSLAMQRWIEVTAPLTIVTLILGYAFIKYEEHKHEDPEELPISTDSKSSLIV